MPLRTFGVLLVLTMLSVSTRNALGQAPTAGAPQLPHPCSLAAGAVSLDGPWQFHAGDDMAWSSPSLDDSGWATIETGRSWEEQGHYGLRGFAWYRRHVDLGPGEQDVDLALLMRGVQDAAEIYWNGRLVGSWGRVPPKPVWYLFNLPQTYSLAPIGAVSSGAQSSASRTGVLAIRVWKAPTVFLNSEYEGGLTRVPRLGSTAAIAALETAAQYRWLRGGLFVYAVALLTLAAGLVALLFWLRDRSRWILLWASLPMFKPVAGILLFGIPGFSTFALGYGWIAELVIVSNISIWFLLLDLLELRDSPRLVRWARVLGVGGFALTLVDSAMVCVDWTRLFPRAFVWLDVISTIPAELMELYSLVLVFAALRNLAVRNRRLDASRWTLAGTVVLAGLEQAVTDWTGLGARWTHLRIADWMSAPIATVWGVGLYLPGVLNVLLLASILYAAWRYSLKQSQRQSALEQEFQSARELQQVLVPDTLPTVEGYAVTSAYKPAQEVGGDFFQIIPLEGEYAGSTLVVLGDVSGKGLKAALAVSLIVGMVRALARFTASPAELLTLLNERLAGSLNGGFATCIAVRVDREGRCTMASAGHLAPFLNQAEFPLPGALPLGIVAGATYDEDVLQLKPGDQLSLYTDGVLEARTEAGELYGFERLQTLFQANPTATQAMDAAVAFGQDDDITVVTLTKLAAAEESKAKLNVPKLVIA